MQDAATGQAVAAAMPRIRIAITRSTRWDLVVQALEKVKADSKSDQLEDANQLLKRATELCGELGDAWSGSWKSVSIMGFRSREQPRKRK